MSYNFMSNISDFSDVTDKNTAFENIQAGYEITFKDRNNIQHNASFLMVRAGDSNDLLIQLEPSSYGVYIPAGEMWSVDSIGEIEKIIIKKIIDPSGNGSALTSGQIQWMIGYK